MLGVEEGLGVKTMDKGRPKPLVVPEAKFNPFLTKEARTLRVESFKEISGFTIFPKLELPWKVA